jgi:hypothetical protein
MRIVNGDYFGQAGKFTNNDMEQQLATLTLQEISYKRDLSALGQTININVLDNWEANSRNIWIYKQVSSIKIPLLKMKRTI